MVALAGHDTHSSVAVVFHSPADSSPERAGLLEGGKAGESKDPCCGASSAHTLM